MHRSFAALIVVAVALTGCDATRRVPEGRYLLKHNAVTVEGNVVAAAELEAIIKQKPNKRILWVPFYLHAYNLPDPAKIPGWQKKRDAHIDRRNARRIAKRDKRFAGKDTTDAKYHAKKYKLKPYKSARAEWLRTKVGEAPVLLDSSLTKRTVDQMQLYMAKEGWFRATASDTVRHTHRSLFGGKRGKAFTKRRVEVDYYVHPGPKYTLRNIRYEVDDPAIRAEVDLTWEHSLLDSGDRVDDDALDAERARITAQLRGDGYLYFTRDLIQYTADTTVGNAQVDLIMRFERPLAKGKRGLQGSPEGRRYYLEDITLAAYRQTRTSSLLHVDTLDTLGYRFLFRDRLAYRPRALLHPVFLKPGELYQQSNHDRTYRRLSGLNVFDRVEIGYDTTNVRAPGLVDARISLLPGRAQNVSFEGFGTNRGGAFGTQISTSYKHRNLFGTLGSITAQLTLGLEAQQRITGGSSTNTESANGLGTGALFNTVSIGPDIQLAFPTRGGSNVAGGSRLLFTALYNYQRRPDYTREVAKFSVGYQWFLQNGQTHTVSFPEINNVRILQRSGAFDNYLRLANDPVLRDSYTNHSVVGLRYVFNKATPEAQAKKRSFYLRGVVDWTGWPLQLFNLPNVTDTATGENYQTFLGVRYAQFFRLDLDARWRRVLHEKSSAAFRLAGGAGVPYGNFPVLPFESSFFVGGANGLRAWRARSIGPGSYYAPLLAFDRIGELRLEGNAEYRFKLIGYLEGAFFVDAGNIWNLKPDAHKPGADFAFDRFLGEVAVGVGAGARLNFEFFIVRFDLGLQTKDPSLPAGERWIFQPKDRYEARLADLGIPGQYKPALNFNLGIGYPF